MSNTNIDGLSREDLLRVVQRDRFVKEQMSARLAGVLHENVELLGLLQEAQTEIAQLRGRSNGEVSTPDTPVDVTS